MNKFAIMLLWIDVAFSIVNLSCKQENPVQSTFHNHLPAPAPIVLTGWGNHVDVQIGINSPYANAVDTAKDADTTQTVRVFDKSISKESYILGNEVKLSASGDLFVQQIQGSTTFITHSSLATSESSGVRFAPISQAYSAFLLNFLVTEPVNWRLTGTISSQQVKTDVPTSGAYECFSVTDVAITSNPGGGGAVSTVHESVQNGSLSISKSGVLQPEFYRFYVSAYSTDAYPPFPDQGNAGFTIALELTPIKK